VSYVVKARARLRDAGEASARPQRNRVAPRLVPHHGAIRAEVASRPSATVADLRAWLASAHGAVVGHAAMWRALDRLGRPECPFRARRQTRRAGRFSAAR
jgi:transposase